MRILLVEDDNRIASFVKRGLREENFAVDLAQDGERALFLAQTETYDLIILDLLLPKRPGIEVLRTLRAERIMTPVLILTAKDELQDKVAGLNAGADDYLTKPFGFEELLARARALLRRGSETASATLRVCDLELDVLKHRAVRGGKNLGLTNREFALLEFFLRSPNQVVTRTMLSEHVWEHHFDTMSNVIDVHVARLRRKIDDGFFPKLLKTIRGRGYILEVPQKNDLKK